MTAAYAGKFTGVEMRMAAEIRRSGDGRSRPAVRTTTVRGLNGDVALVADFGRGTVQGVVGNMKYADGRRTEPEAEAAALMARADGDPYGLRMDAQMTGSTYKARLVHRR